MASETATGSETGPTDLAEIMCRRLAGRAEALSAETIKIALPTRHRRRREKVGVFMPTL